MAVRSVPVIVNFPQIFPEVDACFSRLIHFHGEAAGVDMKPEHFSDDVGEDPSELKRLILQHRVDEFNTFYGTLIYKALQLDMSTRTDPNRKLWLQDYIQKRLRPAMDIDDYVNLVKPLLVPFAVVLEDLKNQYVVTCKFARLSLNCAEQLLANPEKVRAWLKACDDALVLDTTLNQERHPESVTTFNTETSTSSLARSENCCEHPRKR